MIEMDPEDGQDMVKTVQNFLATKLRPQLREAQMARAVVERKIDQ
jgi:hypothetical protein